MKDTEDTISLPMPRLLGSCRLTITIMCFLATLVSNTISTSLSFALVCMKSECGDNVPEGNSSATCAVSNSSGSTQDFDWDPEVRGLILGANFYGVVATQLLGGWLNDKFRKSKVFFIFGFTVNGLSTITVPFVIHGGAEYLIAFRILAGVGAGIYYSSMMPILRSWVTPTEQGFLIGLAYAGSGMGSTLTFPISSLLCKYAGGWPSIFYFFGSCALVWVLAAIFLLYDSPKSHPRVSETEKQYLLSVNHHSTTKKKDVRVPWKKILTSIPVWAVVVTNFCWFSVYKTTIIYLPIFMREALEFSVEQNGLFSGLPSLCAFIAHLILGPLFDWLRSRNFCSLTILRKIYNSIGCFLPALAMYTASQLGPDQKYAVIGLITAAQSLGEFALTGGYSVAILDLAPRYVGVTQGINSTIGLSPGFLTPMLIAALTPTGSREEWTHVFLIYGSLYAFAGLVFLLLGSSERQPWADPPQPSKTEANLIQDT